MRVAAILSTKGSTVATIEPDRPLSDAVARLRQHGVGALVVSADGQRIDGIVSERDVVRHLADGGGSALTDPIATVMTVEVRTCAPDDGLETLARLMTDHRHRHLPVIADGRLVGIVSIGDVVKARLTQLETETRQLQEYISTGR